MATLKASLSDRIDAQGKSEILLRFVGGADHIYRLHSNLYITRARWKDGAIVMPRLGSAERHELQELQSKLDDLKAQLLECFYNADKAIVDRRWMQRQVEVFFHPESSGSAAHLLDAFDKFAEAKDVSERRQARYEVTRKALARWETYRGAPLLVDTVTKEDLEDFDAFLRNEHRIANLKRWAGMYEGQRPPRQRSANALLEYHKTLRAFFHWAVGRGMTHNNPYGAYTVGTALYGTPYYMSLEDVDQLYRADLSARPKLAIQRDIFVFQCQVGCRIGDLLQFTQGDVSEGVLEYIPNKTRGEKPQTVRVPLNATAKEILARYRDEAYPHLLPFISAQKYNDAIKDAFKLAGLTRPVTVLDPMTRKGVRRPLNEIASSHLARRTFIGNLYRVVKDPAIISSMSGHVEGSKAFARYRDIDDDIKNEMVSILDRENKGK